jgi:hypothetical protein
MVLRMRRYATPLRMTPHLFILIPTLAFAAIRLVGFGQFFDVAKNTHMDAMDNAV